jgi:hypothetical protein
VTDDTKRILCTYKGETRRIREEVCYWHREIKHDPECEGCRAWKYPIEEMRNE